MLLSYRYLRLRASHAGLWPQSKIAIAGWYLLGFDLLLFALQKIFGALKLSFGSGLGGWVSFLSFLAVFCFAILAFRWIKARALWRLRNRLIVTYVFIGVIPVVLLVALALGSFYLFAGQFATYVVTSGLQSELRSLDEANAMVARQLAGELQAGPGNAALMDSLKQTIAGATGREMAVWRDGKLLSHSGPPGSNPPAMPSFVKDGFRDVVRDHGQLFLRAVDMVPAGSSTLTVLSSKPFDQKLLQSLAANLGEISLYTTGLSLHEVDQSQIPKSGIHVGEQSSPKITLRKGNNNYVLDTGKEPLTPTYTAGSVPQPVRRGDPQVTFATTVYVVDWLTGDTSSPAGISVQTRVSKLYELLFAALGDLAPAIEFALLFAAIVFAIIELVALYIGTHLTRTVTGAVHQLYDATRHINRGDFSHRIPVRSTDQVATLANSFNSMTASLEKLIEEQKEKQRLENELVIAQEVQAQLFPREIMQLASLEVHGFCRPARTVSGDYYDFLALDADRMILAVGDISGKGISAALLMATIHSAVRAYSVEGVPFLREVAMAGAGNHADAGRASTIPGVEASPGTLLSLLNHQLYESTPTEKYATLFLGLYDGKDRRLTYSNGGHLPPIVISEGGEVRRLEAGGTVVGLFDQQAYDEGCVQLRSGEIFLAYSDGVTEPENDFGEFGEQRLIELVRENRHLSLPRISEIVTAAVDDWIGANEQPDDITLVLARAR